MMKKSKLGLLIIFVFGIGVCQAQDNNNNKKNYSESKSNVSQDDSIKTDYDIIGTNLRNSDGSEMGPFVVENNDDINDKGSRNFMPDEGFESKAYARAMETGNYPEAKEGDNSFRRCDLKREEPVEKKRIF